MNRLMIAGFLVLGATAPLVGEEHGNVLFDFKNSDSLKRWQTVNDGVMGGVSEGKAKLTDEETMLFYGTLSLENNGGFASVRSRPNDLSLKNDQAIVLRVRGDGREYNFNLYVPTREIAFSYRAVFKNKKGEWVEVQLPLKDFVATSFGRVVRGRSLDAKQVNSVGILLGDKRPGPFELEVAWIAVRDAK